MILHRRRHPLQVAALAVLLLAGTLVCASRAQAVAPLQPQFAPIPFFFNSRLGAPAMSSPRAGAAAAVTDGKVLIAGGDNGGLPLATIDLFSPNVRSPGSFKELTATLNPAREYGVAAPLPGGKVLIAGGRGPNAIDLTSAQIYDPATGTVSTAPGQMTTARRGAWAAPLKDGRVLIGGGIDANNNILRSAEIFNPTDNTFTAVTQPMADAVYGATATALPDGRVLIVGGSVSTTLPPLTTVEVYDPATGAFTKLPGGMLVPRAFPAAVTLPDGKVLIAGGYSSPTSGTSVVERSAEIFDPEDATSQELPVSGSTELITARAAAAAALLPNGRVLIAGGDNAANVSISTGELFESSPEASVGATSFGNVGAGDTATKAVTITNIGAQNLAVEGFSVGGPDAADFSVATSTCPGTSFGFEQTCQVNVRFTPPAVGSRVAILTLSDNEPVPLTFIIRGSGVAASAGPGSGSSGSSAGRPILSRVSIRPRRVHVGRGARNGMTVRWRDTMAARTTVRIMRTLTGRRTRGRCVAVSSSNRGHRRCLRFVAVASLTHRDRAGGDALHFSGRVHGHRLAPGRYRLTLQAVSGHRRSRTVIRPFTVVR